MLSAQKLAQALLSETQSTEGGSQAQKVLPTIDTEEGDYSSDDSELQAETIRFFLQVSSPEFEVSLRDLDPMHCLEAPQAACNGSFDLNTLALLHSVVWSGCLGFFLALWETEDLNTDQHGILQSVIRAAHLQGAHVAFFFPPAVPCSIGG